uniref:RAP domain-containing protein n=1 Tax=Tetradesmus obliquus TaxID=3088 RepID=A0A383V5D3_TETOB|eukprot:jgi/Sobl393_1/8987/SZX60808.1
MEAWSSDVQAAAKQPSSSFRLSVLAAVQQLPIAWQQQLQILGARASRHSRDSVLQGRPLSAAVPDITGTTADGVLVAIQANTAKHLRRPDWQPTGPTQYRNRALIKRGYRLVVVPSREWDQLRGDPKRQQQYLMRLFKEAGVV